MRHEPIKLLFFILCLSVFQYACQPKRYPGPLSPEEALKQFTIADGFEISLFAAEPFVKDPVDMAFDEQGNIYVVEMPDYPSEQTPGKPAGCIRFLEDTDGDGRIDKTTTFADSLSEATSIMPWKGGLLVTAAPYILFLKDTTGDHKADLHEVIFSGFFKANSEAQITSLRWGVDNWIYANNRGQDGVITYTRKKGEPLSVRGADFRFRLDRDAFEPETGPGQFGQTLDASGHRYFTENTLHIQQAVIPWRYLHRHPYLESANAVVNISDHDPLMYQVSAAPYWRVERTRRRNELFRQQNMNEEEFAEGHFTGASGGTVYLSDLFPAPFYGNIFTGDVAGNLVHRDVIEMPAGSVVSVAGRAAGEKEKEFLSTTDSWFRPVNLHVGPDGSLYVIDMYRQHIETPLSIPEDLQTDMDFFAGADKGRIYRVRPKGKGSPAVDKISLANSSVEQLVDNLGRDNQWLAIQSHRLLLEKKDSSTTALLYELLASDQPAAAKIRALSLLEGMGRLTTKQLFMALGDASPAVRKHAIILAENIPSMTEAIVAACADSNAEVALQATLSLGNTSSMSVIPHFVQVLQAHGADSWFRLAVCSSETGSSPEMVLAVIESKSIADSVKAAFLQEAGFVTGVRNDSGQIAMINSRLQDKRRIVDDKLVRAFNEGLKNGGEKKQHQQNR